MVKQGKPTNQTNEKQIRIAKKLARREKQRKENVTRAQQMHIARIASPDTDPIYYDLPILNIGCSGWFYWHWRNKFYPNTLTTNQWFDHYRKHFKTVELNAPFYSWPTQQTVKAWLRAIKHSQFIYTVKVSELITHTKQFVKTDTLVKDFYFIGKLLGENLGCFLFQLPPSFTFTPTRLKRIVRQLNPKFRNVVEFRHASWWNPEVYKSFKKHNIIFCSTSSPKLPQDIIKTTDEIYLRFHGSSKMYRHNYSKKELNLWVEQIAALSPKRIWAYFNNDNEAYAIQNAKTFLKQLKKELL